MMTAIQSHEGGQAFLRRARHFARREVREQEGALPVSPRMLSYFLLHLAGANVGQIATWEGERREAILPRVARHDDVTPEDAAEWSTVTRQAVAEELMLCIALIGRGPKRARIALLAEQMGRINFEPREGQLVRFPGPSRLIRTHVVEVA